VQPFGAKQQLQGGLSCLFPEDGQVMYPASCVQYCGHTFALTISGLKSRIAPTQ